MEVNRLLGDEIVYELQIRGLPIQRLVNDNRTTLRGALRMERQGFCSFVLSHLNPEEEFQVCRDKLIDIGEDVQNFDRSNYENEHKRLRSRLIHLSLRLRRVPSTSEEEEETKQTLMVECLRLVEAVEEAYEEVVASQNNPAQATENQRSILDEPNILLPEIAANDTSVGRIPPRPGLEREAAQNLMSFAQGPLFTSRPTEIRQDAGQTSSFQAVGFHPSSSRRATLGTGELRTTFEQPSTHQEQTGVDSAQLLRNRLMNLGLSGHSAHDYSLDGQSRFVDVSRWRLQFDGESSVTSFLERVEELRISRNVSHEQLLRSAVELFTKEALLWYRTQTFSSWEDLVVKLKQAFTPYDYELDLWDEIRRRTQGSKERVISYIAAVENLFNRLGDSKPKEKTRVDWLKRGLLPHIQSHLALQVIETVSELTRLSRMVEETFIRTQRFCPPPSNSRSLLEPDLAYRKPSNSHQLAPSCSVVGTSISQTHGQPRESESELKRVDETNAPVCWNCGKRGHRFKKCSEPRNIFCYRCGLEKVVAKNCPACTKNRVGGSK